MISTWEILPFGQGIGMFRAMEMLGHIPHFLDLTDPRPVKAQINQAYQHGGGWRPMQGWKRREDGEIGYPGDPALLPIARARVGEEWVYVYPHAWVAIVQKDGTFEIARLD